MWFGKIVHSIQQYSILPFLFKMALCAGYPMVIRYLDKLALHDNLFIEEAASKQTAVPLPGSTDKRVSIQKSIQRIQRQRLISSALETKSGENDSNDNNRFLSSQPTPEYINDVDSSNIEYEADDYPDDIDQFYKEKSDSSYTFKENYDFDEMKYDSGHITPKIIKNSTSLFNNDEEYQNKSINRFSFSEGILNMIPTLNNLKYQHHSTETFNHLPDIKPIKISRSLDPIASLGSLVHYNILSYLTDTELATSQKVSQEWYQSAEKPALWDSLLMNLKIELVPLTFHVVDDMVTDIETELNRRGVVIENISSD